MSCVTHMDYEKIIIMQRSSLACTLPPIDFIKSPCGSKRLQFADPSEELGLYKVISAYIMFSPMSLMEHKTKLW